MEKLFFKLVSNDEIEEIFFKIIQRKEILSWEIKAYKTKLLLELAKEYKKYDLGMQIHIGAMRNNNTRMYNKLGPDIGTDSMGDYNYARELSALLNELDKNDELPKTILYCINLKENEVLASMIGNFQSDERPGKMQFGSIWWFLDQKKG